MRGDAARIVVAPLSALEGVAREARPEAVISLMSTPDPVPTPAEVDPRRHLRLTFNDVVDAAAQSRGLVPPSRAHVGAILEAARNWTGTAPLLVHCWFGVSRSTAAAAIVLAALRPDLSASRIAAELRAAAPFATPNARMIALADAMIGRDGTLRAAIEAIGRGEECSQGVPFSLLVSGERP